MRIIEVNLTGKSLGASVIERYRSHPLFHFVIRNRDAFLTKYREACNQRGLSCGFLTVSLPQAERHFRIAQTTGVLAITDIARFEPYRVSDRDFDYKYDFSNHFYVTMIFEEDGYMFDLEFPIYN